jgi:hypothetical protein
MMKSVKCIVFGIVHQIFSIGLNLELLFLQDRKKESGYQETDNPKVGVTGSSMVILWPLYWSTVTLDERYSSIGTSY